LEIEAFNEDLDEEEGEFSPLLSSVFCYLLHPFPAYFVIFHTRFECSLAAESKKVNIRQHFTPVSTARQFHSFRV
jgi:hypothetical protein